jgi:hypothetical protein
MQIPSSQAFPSQGTLERRIALREFRMESKQVVFLMVAHENN